ncbi:radical SAM protein [Oceanotoga sp. DSM 15011]|uniref:radical SAM protein n=1 Tax=Oceanotoga sp. DSM 15011 TaxID=2984951 RepID=UPI0021F4B9F8|nr:radical SAM protein [Oceanotoga sp. DSM 15011]UYP00917.1 radical SAM protein [Oceanotoga sp. DSM 15011]
MTKIEDIIWTISEKCEGRCKHCELWKKKIDYNDELSLDMIENVISNNMLKDLIQVHITGGEPFISPKYVPLIEILLKYHPMVRIHSPISGMYPELHYSISKYISKKLIIIY